MEPFDFFFAVVAILLGLALTELASGIAGALKAHNDRREVAIGWLSPLAALIICLDIATIVAGVWDVRGAIAIGPRAIIIAVLLCLGYYVAASFVFPDRFAEHQSLDDWFWRNRRYSLGGTLLLSFLHNVTQTAMGVEPLPAPEIGAIFARYWGWLLFVALYLVMILAKRRAVVLGAMATVLTIYFLFYFVL